MKGNQQSEKQLMATMRKKAKASEEPLNLDSILFKCRDILRKARNSGSFFEKRDLMLTLIFLRFIGEKFEDGVVKLRKNLKAQGLDPDSPDIQAAFLDDPVFRSRTWEKLEQIWDTAEQRSHRARSLQVAFLLSETTLHQQVTVAVNSAPSEESSLSFTSSLSCEPQRPRRLP